MVSNGELSRTVIHNGSTNQRKFEKAISEKGEETLRRWIVKQRK
jgi:hypothetical protein